MEDFSALASDIIKYAGGRNNIKAVIHCATRLRFVLDDESKTDTDKIKEAGAGIVVGIVESKGQYQIILGNYAADVYEAVVRVGGLESKAMGFDEKGFEDGLDRFDGTIRKEPKEGRKGVFSHLFSRK